MKQVHWGLSILLKYEEDGDCAAEHDTFYAGTIHPNDMEKEDVTALETHGWFYDNDLETWITFV